MALTLDQMTELTGSYGGALAETGRQSVGDSTAEPPRISFMVELADQLGLDVSDTSTARSTYNDVDGLTPHQLGAVSALTEMGIISGTGGGSLSPEASMQRGHFALMLDRAGIDSGDVFTQGRMTDPITGNEVPYILDRLPGATYNPGPINLLPDKSGVGGLNYAEANQNLPTSVGGLRDRNLAELYNPLNDARFAVYSANAGLDLNMYIAQRDFLQTNRQIQLDFMASRLQDSLDMAARARSVAESGASRARSAVIGGAKERLGAAKDIMGATIERAQGALQSTIERNRPIYDHERWMSQKRTNQDYESRGFFRSGARGVAVAEGKKAIDLAQFASEEAAQQAFLNTQTSAQNAYRGAEGAFAATRGSAEASYANQVAAAEQNFLAQQLGLQQAYDQNVYNINTGTNDRLWSIEQQIAAVTRDRALEEVNAIQRLTQNALSGVGGF